MYLPAFILDERTECFTPSKAQPGEAEEELCLFVASNHIGSIDCLVEFRK